MSWFDWFRKQEQPQDLEAKVRMALSTNGVKVVYSRPEGDYDPIQVVGIGDTEKDSSGALKHFTDNIPKAKPAYAMSISIGTVYMGVRRNPRKRISAMIYTQTSPKPAA